MSIGTHRTGSLPVIDRIVEQHADEASFLWLQRRSLVLSSQHLLQQLADRDSRLSAHLEGLRIAAEGGWKPNAAPEDPGALFVATVLALAARDLESLDALVSMAEGMPALDSGLIGAFGWISATFLQGTAKELLTARSAFRRRVGIACCVRHGVDPGKALETAAVDVDPVLQACALRAVGELGRGDLRPLCERYLGDRDGLCELDAAWSAVMLGNRGVALDVLTRAGMEPGPDRAQAFRLMLQAMNLGASHGVLQRLGGDVHQLGWLIQGSGIAGDPKYVPWLINHLRHDKTARLAGEALSLITGIDLTALNFERPHPEGFEAGPNDDPNDSNVDMDPDEGLAWPDLGKIEKWWAANSSRFAPGTRYFMGAPVTREHCIEVLKNGYQRQRILAAHYLCLLDPGTPLFNTSAPAWRQQRLLAKMG